MLLGALMVHGLQARARLLFQSSPEFVWGLIASMYIANVMLLILNLPLVGLLGQPAARALQDPDAPHRDDLRRRGLHHGQQHLRHVGDVRCSAIIGYLMRKLKFPAAPVVLALVLGPMVERTLRQSLTISHGDVSIFFTRPISAVLIAVALISLFAPLLRGVMDWRKKVVEIS